jgi:YD repeat-containing protein
MSDLARWELRGPVRTLRTHFAEWNSETGDWWPLKNRFVAMFRPDGQLSEIEHHNPDGSVPREVRVYDEGGRLTEHQWWANDVVTRRALHTYDLVGRPASSVTVDSDGTKREAELCQYDDNGRKMKVVFLPVPEGSGGASCSTGSCGTMYGVEGTDVSYSAPGATTSTTTYDEHERPSEVTFHDANNALVSRVMFSRDQDGRVLSERMEFAGPGGLLGPAIDANMPTDERASLMELLKTAFEDYTFSLATYAYDEKGRRIESVRRMGKLSEERVTVRYDDFDNPVEQVDLDVSRDMRMEDGAVKSEEKPPHVQHVRFEYQYDAHGNWTERIVLQRMEPNTDERPSSVERRTIAYHTE